MFSCFRVTVSDAYFFLKTDGYGIFNVRTNLDIHEIKGGGGGYAQTSLHKSWLGGKGNIGETPERRGGAHMGLPVRIDTILNWTELNWTELSGEKQKLVLAAWPAMAI